MMIILRIRGIIASLVIRVFLVYMMVTYTNSMILCNSRHRPSFYQPMETCRVGSSSSLVINYCSRNENQSSCSSTDKEGQQWLTYDQLKSLSDEIDLTFDEIQAKYIGATYCSRQPLFRLRNGHESLLNLMSVHDCNQIARLERSVAVTYRWCSNFVQHLNLCPWAQGSLDSKNAIRIKIVNQSDGFDMIEKVMEESSLELIEETESCRVDPYLGITFVVAIPDKLGESKCGTLFDFISFYDFFNDLEERILDENIGENVTIAPFHPEWTYASPNENYNDEDPVNYEKKSPFPTISIVMSSGIELAGQQATSKIGLHNEEILNEMGCNRLEKLYREEVLKDAT